MCNEVKGSFRGGFLGSEDLFFGRFFPSMKSWAGWNTRTPLILRYRVRPHLPKNASYRSKRIILRNIERVTLRVTKFVSSGGSQVRPDSNLGLRHYS